MKIILKVNDFIKRVEVFLIEMSVIAMSILLISNVIFRVVFNSSITFAEEVGKIFIMIITFAGLPYASRIARHINMTAIVDILPPKARKSLHIIVQFITAVILFYLGYLGVMYVISLQFLGRVTPALGIPSWITFLILPAGFFLAGIQFLLSVVLNITHKEDFYLSPDVVENSDIIDPKGI